MNSMNVELNEEERMELEQRSWRSNKTTGWATEEVFVRFAVVDEGFFSFPEVQTCSGAQPPSYSIDTGGFTRK